MVTQLIVAGLGPGSRLPVLTQQHVLPLRSSYFTLTQLGTTRDFKGDWVGHTVLMLQTPESGLWRLGRSVFEVHWWLQAFQGSAPVFLLHFAKHRGFGLSLLPQLTIPGAWGPSLPGTQTPTSQGSQPLQHFLGPHVAHSLPSFLPHSGMASIGYTWEVTHSGVEQPSE